MRVGPEDDPQWAAWRLDRHRSPPPGAQVRWATVVRRARGPHAEWSLHLTVGTGLGSAPAPTGKQVAVDVGWRVIGDELRVAAWRDSDGQSGELRLTAKDSARALRSRLGPEHPRHPPRRAAGAPARVDQGRGE